jgi:hypothetical protein
MHSPTDVPAGLTNMGMAINNHLRLLKLLTW